MQNTEIFKLIDTLQYKKCREKLERHYLPHLDNILEKLKTKPDPSLVKPLRGKLEGKHVARFANQSYRLVIKINWDSKSIILLYLAPRARSYTGKMW